MSNLISDEYQALVQAMHEAHPGWGSKGHQLMPRFIPFLKTLGCRTVLDYGCGKGRMKAELEKLGLTAFNYDPGVPEWSALPEPAEFVVSIDTLEHIEPDLVMDVLTHIRSLTLGGAYLYISTKPAKAVLPDGCNAHLSVHPATWWLEQIQTITWTIDRYMIGQKGVEIWLCLGNKTLKRLRARLKSS